MPKKACSQGSNPRCEKIFLVNLTMNNDPIGDYLTRIRNAQLRKQEEVVMPSSNMLVSISEILKKNEYIEGYEVVDEKKAQKSLVLKLKYVDDEPAIRSLTRISKPGLRTYVGYKDIPKVLSGKGISVFSTPKGVLSGQEAKQSKVGGEYICEIW